MVRRGDLAYCDYSSTARGGTCGWSIDEPTVADPAPPAPRVHPVGAVVQRRRGSGPEAVRYRVVEVDGPRMRLAQITGARAKRRGQFLDNWVTADQLNQTRKQHHRSALEPWPPVGARVRRITTRPSPTTWTVTAHRKLADGTWRVLIVSNRAMGTKVTDRPAQGWVPPDKLRRVRH